ncbi:hypothetical protein I7I53_09230 [Histoplasma capsulatum var. duboisii H88]|uniref:Uncharacterized protein n=1 Tax=Ajellomyces capsulatus (strain H88) TaxID=544711 RepID=A0A8A1LB37_AJEC8|nr:hypothetical protein I7I53_09230 [Histoplasma capsulatum var. duboisii H88]
MIIIIHKIEFLFGSEFCGLLATYSLYTPCVVLTFKYLKHFFSYLFSILLLLLLLLTFIIYFLLSTYSDPYTNFFL